MITESEVEEFHILGNIPHREITKTQADRWQQLYEKVYEKQVLLTKNELRTRIKQKPLNRKTIEECFQKISKVHKNNYGSFCGFDLYHYPNRVYKLDINFSSKDGVGIEIIHEFCHVLYEDGNSFKNGGPTEYIIDEYARFILTKDPELPDYILKRLNELGKFVE